MCENEKGVLNNIFESRKEELYTSTQIDKRKIKHLTKSEIL